MDAATLHGDPAAPTHGDTTAAAAGAACLRALRNALDALGVPGAASAAREARSFRANMGVPATAGARGAFALQALRAASTPGPGGGGPPSPPRRGAAAAAHSPLRRSPRLATQQTALALLDDSPRSQTIRQLMAEKAAEEEARGVGGPRARLGEGRRLRFDAPDAEGATAPPPDDGGSGASAAAPHERNVRSSLATEFGELRPRGAETMPTADVVRALEAELGGSGR
eukprot:4818549-Pleurochrysis_carterae.AAC.1